MKIEITDKKNKQWKCSACDKDIEFKLSQLLQCSVCKKETEKIDKKGKKILVPVNHYIEVAICSCGEHYYNFQSLHLLKQREMLNEIKRR